MEKRPGRITSITLGPSSTTMLLTIKVQMTLAETLEARYGAPMAASGEVKDIGLAYNCLDLVRQLCLICGVKTMQDCVNQYVMVTAHERIIRIHPMLDRATDAVCNFD